MKSFFLNILYFSWWASLDAWERFTICFDNDTALYIALIIYSLFLQNDLSLKKWIKHFQSIAQILSFVTNQNDIMTQFKRFINDCLIFKIERRAFKTNVKFILLNQKMHLFFKNTLLNGIILRILLPSFFRILSILLNETLVFHLLITKDVDMDVLLPFFHLM